jgi:hypothetical protein
MYSSLRNVTASLVLRFSSDARHRQKSGVEAETAKDFGGSFLSKQRADLSYVLSSLTVLTIASEQLTSKLCRVVAIAFDVDGQVIMRMNAQRIRTLELQRRMAVVFHESRLLVIKNAGSLTR